MGSKRIFILDGHNIIFALPGLNRLQTSGRRAEARTELTDRAERFARASGHRVSLVFDGGGPEHAGPEQGGPVRMPALRVGYAPRAEGGADVRILREARRCLEEGLTVTVVTDDRSTLACALPPGARRMAVREFWLRHIEPPQDPEAKRIEGDFSDLEREMLARAAAAEPPGAGRASPPPPADRGTPARARTGAGGRVRPGPDEAAGERVRRKRERGRRRQERRLGRRSVRRGGT
jgi:predicted RNA-binding protein with PIN domain